MGPRSLVCALASAMALPGCLPAADVPCGDLVCPVEDSCVADRCVSASQLAACDGLADGASCQVGGAEGVCEGGACGIVACGNGVVDPGEACDDGNTSSGDGCRGDCKKLEVCGDSIVDANEQCDDGNANAADGCDQCQRTAWQATAIVSGNALAVSVGLANPPAVAVGRDGALYIADFGANVVRRVDPAMGIITIIAGTGVAAFTGDGGQATAAALDGPQGLAIDGLGAVFISDSVNARIRRVDPQTGIITTVAGNGSTTFSGDDGPATTAGLPQIEGIAVDGVGNIYVAAQDRIRRVDAATAIITTVAGGGPTAGSAADGSLATAAALAQPIGIALDGSDDLYIADGSADLIRRVDAVTHKITTVAGGGSAQGNGSAATGAALAGPEGVAVAANGDVYIADTLHDEIRRVVASNQKIALVAGSGSPGASGDGGPARTATLRIPQAVALDAAGNVYIADTRNNRIRVVDATTAVISTVAGTGAYGNPGDGQAATSAALVGPRSVTVDGSGAVYVTDFDDHRVRRVDPATGVIETVAGAGIALGSDVSATADIGDLAPAVDAPMGPSDAVVDAAHDLFIADLVARRIRRVDGATGIITTIAGDGSVGNTGDGQPASGAQIVPYSLALDAGGDLYVGDVTSHVIRRIDATTGVITRIAGTGTAGSAGDGGPAIQATITSPRALKLDAAGDVYFADTVDHCVRRVVAATGVIERVAGACGTGAGQLGGDGGPAIDAGLSNPEGLAFDAAGDLLIADSGNARIRRVDTAGTITTVVGTGGSGSASAGDGSGALAAALVAPSSVAVDAAGTLYIADTGASVIRGVDGITQRITTFAGHVEPVGMGPLSAASLADPRAIAIGSDLMLIAGGESGTVQELRGSAVSAVAGRYLEATATGMLARFRGSGFGDVLGVAYDGAHTLYMTESSSNAIHAIEMPEVADADSWTITDLVPAGSGGFRDGALAAALFHDPTGLFFDAAADQLYVADTANHVIRRIDLAAGVVSTVAGSPETLGYFGDGGPAIAALLDAPEAITRCGSDLFIADTANDRVRRVVADGTISTVLGDGVADSAGDGMPATSFPVAAPLGLACDAGGNLFVTSTTAVRLLPSDAEHVVDGTGGVQTIYGAPPRTAFPQSVTRCLSGIGIVGSETVEVTDACTGLLVQLELEATP